MGRRRKGEVMGEYGKERKRGRRGENARKLCKRVGNGAGKRERNRIRRG